MIAEVEGYLRITKFHSNQQTKIKTATNFKICVDMCIESQKYKN